MRPIVHRVIFRPNYFFSFYFFYFFPFPTPDPNKLATLSELLPHEADLPPSKPGKVSRCRQCCEVRQLHGRAPLCMPCVKHNGANMRLFRDSFPGVSPAEHLELFVYGR